MNAHSHHAVPEALDSSEVFGIEYNHHYGITTHPLVAGETLAQTVYRLTRAWHPETPDGYGLSDANHTFRVDMAEEDGWWSRIVIVKNDLSPLFRVFPGVPRWNYEDGAGAPWFTQEFRLGRRDLIDAEIAEARRLSRECHAEALAQKDTYRGMTTAKKSQSLAQLFARRATVIAARWPQYGAVYAD